MKVFFAASLRGKHYYAKYYKQIYKEIEELGHTHLDDSTITSTNFLDYGPLDPEGKATAILINKRRLQAIHAADICIFEASYQTSTTGFLTSKALESHKPTIVLYLTDNHPFFLDGITDEKLIMYEYTDETIKKTVKQAIDEAHKKREQRFNFFINADLLNFLDEQAKLHNTTKSFYIRDLIEKDQLLTKGK